LIPISNYVGINIGTAHGLTVKQHYQWAIMDTFDMFVPAFDQPQTLSEVEPVLKAVGIAKLRRTDATGLCLDGEKTTAQEPQSKSR